MGDEDRLDHAIEGDVAARLPFLSGALDLMLS
jgi:hypothetical protein